MYDYHEILINRISEKNRILLEHYKDFMISNSVLLTHNEKKFESLKEKISNNGIFIGSFSNFNLVLKNDFFYIINSTNGPDDSRQQLLYATEISKNKFSYLIIDSDEYSVGNFKISILNSSSVKSKEDVVEEIIRAEWPFNSNIYGAKYGKESGLFLGASLEIRSEGEPFMPFGNYDEKTLKFLAGKHPNIISFILENAHLEITELIDLTSIYFDFDLTEVYKQDNYFQIFVDTISSLSRNLRDSSLINKSYNKKNILSLSDIPF